MRTRKVMEYVKLEMVTLVDHRLSDLQRLEMIPYNAEVALRGNIRGKWKGKIYQEVGLETLEDRIGSFAVWLNCLEVNLHVTCSRNYPLESSCNRLRNSSNRSIFKVKHDTIFPSSVIEWSTVDSNTQNSEYEHEYEHF